MYRYKDEEVSLSLALCMKQGQGQHKLNKLFGFMTSFRHWRKHIDVVSCSCYLLQLDKNTRLLYPNWVLHLLAVACLNYQQPLEGQQP